MAKQTKRQPGRPKIHAQPQVRLNLWMGQDDRELLRAAAWYARHSHAGMIAAAVNAWVKALPAADRKRVLEAARSGPPKV